ncbi:MAG TPA: hypothetical protein VHA74_01000 [Candidatus Dojkabacteria bacterium]|nr:hypothetical protein [Candidatus Dojkabacteria bacterium]
MGNLGHFTNQHEIARRQGSIGHQELIQNKKAPMVYAYIQKVIFEDFDQGFWDNDPRKDIYTKKVNGCASYLTTVATNERVTEANLLKNVKNCHEINDLLSKEQRTELDNVLTDIEGLITPGQDI